MDAQFWDDLYGSRDQLFSGNPNGVLVTEVTGLPPGQALDVGCGEGADAHWLAARGWQVTAIDISEVALRRAAAMDVTGRVAWARADLNGAPPPAGAFDLVSLQYFPLPHQPHHTALRALLAAVAPGGTLLVAAHDLADHNHAAHNHADHDAADHAQHQGHAFDPGDFYQPDEIVKLLDDNWTILVDETRPRTAPAPEGTNHINDIVVRAQRIR